MTASLRSIFNKGDLHHIAWLLAASQHLKSVSNGTKKKYDRRGLKELKKAMAAHYSAAVKFDIKVTFLQAIKEPNARGGGSCGNN
eukprot:1177922-Prorocentrum_minimum.AAC.3